MELDERPTEQYSDIGGLDKQIEEVRLIGILHCSYSESSDCALCSWWRL